MIDRTEFLYQNGDPDGAKIALPVWVPPKTLVEEFLGFKIFKSAPSEDSDACIQFSIVHPEISGDMLRAESSNDGLASAYWLSEVQLPEFLDAAERYFQEFEHEFSKDSYTRLGVFTSWGEPEFYDFDRPLIMEDFEKEGAFLGDKNHPLGLLRIDTPPGDVTFEPDNKTVGILAYLDLGKEQPTIDAVARFVTRTQILLPEKVVARTIELLPYRRIPQEN